MKKIYALSFAFILCAFVVNAQTTVTYTLDVNSEDATIDNYSPSNNYPNEIEMASRAWTISSTPVTWRSLFKFNLSCIPPNATVTNANLTLFYAAQNNFGNAQHSSLSSSDESVLQRVTSWWSENTVTWNNQPSATSIDQVILPQSTSGTQDYPNLDVTAMVQQMVSYPSANFGFLLHLTNETAYAQMFFASGDNPVVGKRPSITITYTIPATDCFTLTLDAFGQDATIDDYGPSNNYPNEIEYASRAWTISSVPVSWRSLFKFVLPCDLSNAVVQSATLSLYFAMQNGFGNDTHSSLTSSNESIVQRVTSPWAENTVTWSNQPSTTTTDQVILPQSSSPTQDYPNLNVTAMVQQMLSNPALNEGFMLRLTTETAYAQMFFASGDNPDSSKHPTLQVCYTLLTSVDAVTEQNGLTVFPNPASDELLVSGLSSSIKTINIFNSIGAKIFSGKLTSGEKQIKLNVQNFSPGIYVVSINGEKINRTVKFVKE
jgi:Secretion system C-terminal sorting domain/TGF-beta propeptide